MTMTFEQAAKLYASARDKVAGKPLENNTRLVRLGDDAYGVKLHATVIVTVHRDGTYTLNAGGWRTVTTKDRINTYAPCVVYSNRGTWYVKGDGQVWEDRETGKRVKHAFFADGMRLDAEGRSLASEEEQETALRAASDADEMKERIRKYADKAARWLKHEQLVSSEAGDCWACSMQTDDGQTMGDASGDHDHLLGHMAEGYVMVSLLVNALKEAGYRDAGVSIHLGYHENGDGEGVIGGIAHRQWGDDPYANIPTVKRAVRKYLANRLIAVGVMR